MLAFSLKNQSEIPLFNRKRTTFALISRCSNFKVVEIFDLLKK